jgi:replicative DNA helicase
MVTNIAAERSLLTCMVKDSDTFFALADYLSTDDFTHIANQQIFDCLRQLYVDEGITKVAKNKILVAAKNLNFQNFASVTNNLEILDQILAASVDPKEFQLYFKSVKAFTLRRQYEDVLSLQGQYVKETTDNPLSIIQKMESAVCEVGNGFKLEESGPVKLCDDIQKTIEELAENPGHLGIDLGWPVWQHKVGQCRNGAITFVVGTAKSSKSQMALRASLNTANRLGLPVFYADSELNKQTQQVRLTGMMSAVPYDIIESGFWKLSKEQLEKKGLSPERVEEILEYGRRLKNPELWNRLQKDIRPLIEYCPIYGMSVTDVIPQIKRWLVRTVKPDSESKFPQCLVVYDYIKLASIDEIKSGRIPEWQMHGLHVAALHDFAQRYNIPILAFGQTNNELTDGPRCIAGGKRILENVDSATLLKKKDADEIVSDNQGSHYLNIFVSRFGEGTGMGHINFNIDSSIGSFQELGYSNINFVQEKKKRLEKARDDHNDH